MDTNQFAKNKPLSDNLLSIITNNIEGYTRSAIRNHGYLDYSGELGLRVYNHYESIEGKIKKRCQVALIESRYDDEKKPAYCVEFNIENQCIVLIFALENDSDESWLKMENSAKEAYIKICKIANLKTKPFN